MRKLQQLAVGLGLLAATACAPSAVHAQTTFQASNDPTASVIVVTADATQTIVVITRSLRDEQPTPFSPASVLRDPHSGISYEMRQSHREVSKDGRLESFRASFRAFDSAVLTFDLLDPARQQQSLYVSQIEVGTLTALDTGR